MGTMTKIDLIFPKDVYFPGEEVSGKVCFSSKNKIECKRIKVTFKGELQTSGYTMEFVSKSRKKKFEHTKKIVIHNEEKEISQTAAFDPGDYKLEFNFTIPEDSKISYEGHHGYVRYSISAKMEISRIHSKKARKAIKIVQTADKVYQSIRDPKAPVEVTRKVAEHEGVNILEAEMDTPMYCISGDITIRYLVNTDMNFDVLRVEVWHAETTHLPGKNDMRHEKIIWLSDHIRSENVIRNAWQTWTLKIDKEFPPLVWHEYHKSGLYLKFILGRSFRLDKVVTFPLFAGYCPIIVEPSDSEDGEPISEPKPRPTRLRCNICSYTFKPKEEDEEFSTCPSCGRNVSF